MRGNVCLLVEWNDVESREENEDEVREIKRCVYNKEKGRFSKFEYMYVVKDKNKI